mgnify:CR=1 FL=1
MAKYKNYQPERIYLTVIDPDKIKKDNPLLKTIHEFVENHVSLDLFTKKARNQNTGAPRIHPKALLKVLFFAFASGIYSSRKIEKKLEYDHNFIFLSDQQGIDHVSICIFINEYGKEIKEIFTKMTYILRQSGLIDYELLAIDGTKIRANVSNEFSGTIKDFKEKKERIEKKINKILNEIRLADTREEEQRQEKKRKRFERQKEKIESFLQEVEKEEKASEGKVNLTDQEARYVKDQRQIYMGFNAQNAVDAKHHFIVESEVYNQASDRSLFVPFMEKTIQNLEPEVKINETVLDAGYYSSENILYGEKEFTAYIPEGKDEKYTRKKKPGAIESRDCELSREGENAKLVCPGGQIMIKETASKTVHGEFYRFFAKKSICDQCGYKSRCFKNLKRQKKFEVKKEYFESLEARQRMSERINSVEGRKKYQRRACIVEHVFGEIKEHYGFRKFMRKGLAKANVIWKLICMGYNFRKMAKLMA